MKTFIPLENNPEVMTSLAHTLGLSPSLAFYDVYALSPASLLSHIPRPCHALLATIPLTPSFHALRLAEDNGGSGSGSDGGRASDYNACGPDEPVLWFKQTIAHACGLIGLLHCVLNGPPAAEMLVRDSTLEQLRTAAIPLSRDVRAKLLESSAALEAAHRDAAQAGDTAAPADLAATERLGNHFIAFVRGADGHLWELEGSRRGPLDRGVLGAGEDVLSPGALERGVGRYLRLEQEEAGGKEWRFSCIALAGRG